KAAARLMAVVVFPTPPFWLAMAITIRCTVANYRSISLSICSVRPRCSLCLCGYLLSETSTETQSTQRVHRENLHWQITGFADHVRPFFFTWRQLCFFSLFSRQCVRSEERR